MGSFSAFHWIVVAGVVALLFGRGKISGLMGDVAQGIKSFKRGMAEDDGAPGEAPPAHGGRPNPAGSAAHHGPKNRLRFPKFSFRAVHGVSGAITGTNDGTMGYIQ